MVDHKNNNKNNNNNNNNRSLLIMEQADSVLSRIVNIYIFADRHLNFKIKFHWLQFEILDPWMYNGKIFISFISRYFVKN